MKGDFTRDTFHPEKGYNRVAKQQGRVDLDADFNEQAEILVHRDRVEATDVIGKVGVPKHGGGFKLDSNAGELSYTPGRIYVDGILCEALGEAPILLNSQVGYTPPTAPGSYIAYIDVWDRYVSAIQDPSIKEIALGGPDTAGRIQSAFQVKLLPLTNPPPFSALVCVPFPSPISNGVLSARTDPGKPPENPCVVGEEGGYRGLENRLYRVEIQDDGRDVNNNLIRPVTFKWSRDNGSVLLEVAPGGIDNETVTVLSLGPDSILTVKIGDWVELSSEESEWQNKPGLLAQVLDIDPGDGSWPKVVLDRSASSMNGQSILKLRRWDQQDQSAIALVDGAVPIQGAFYELEDGIQVRFDESLVYRTGDYWQIPARTRSGTLEWPGETEWVSKQGVEHHYATLAMLEFSAAGWRIRDCRKRFPPLTELDGKDCCISVYPGESIQDAIDLVNAAGGGCVEICSGLHELRAPLRIESAAYVTLKGCGDHSRVVYLAEKQTAALVIKDSHDIECISFFLLADGVQSCISVTGNSSSRKSNSRDLRFERLTVINTSFGSLKEKAAIQAAAIRAPGSDGISIRRCRLAASVALSLPFGDELPALPTLKEAVAGALAGLSFQDFSGFDEKPSYAVGDSVTDKDVTIGFEAFSTASLATGTSNSSGNTSSSSNGSARLRSISNGTGLDLNNILAVFSSSKAIRRVAFAFVYRGGSLNLRVNDELRSVNNVDELNNITLGGAEITVSETVTAGSRQGIIRVQSPSNLQNVAIAGQELLLNGFAIAGAVEGIPQRADFGYAVHNLEVIDSTLRFTEVGVLACALYHSRFQNTSMSALPKSNRFSGSNSRVESLLGSFVRNNVNLATGEIIGETIDETRRNSIGKTTGESTKGQLGRRLELYGESLFEQPPESKNGLGMGAWLLSDVSIIDCAIQSSSGIFAIWQDATLLRGGSLSCREQGFSAGFLQNSQLIETEINCQQGSAVLLGAVSRSQLNSLIIKGNQGVTNLGITGWMRAIQSIVPFISAAAYGRRDEAALRGLLWLLLEETIDYAKFRPWFDALDALIAQSLASFPWTTSMVLAMSAESLVKTNKTELKENSQSSSLDNSLGLTFLDLEMNNLDITAKDSAISLRNILPLGSLRVEGCTLVSIEGRGVEILANTYASHMALFEQLLLFSLSSLEKTVAKQGQGTTKLSNFFKAVDTSLKAWLLSARKRFSSESQIIGNSIQSTRTGIDTNLFDANISRNHITLPERAGISQAPSPARIFGRVLSVAGAPISGASVYVPEASTSVSTDVQGNFNLPQLSSGSFSPQVSAAGYQTQYLNKVTLGSGESRELNVTLNAYRISEWSYGYSSFNSAMYTSGANTYIVGNSLPRIAVLTNSSSRGLIESLERSDGFLELADILRDSAYLDPAGVAKNIESYAMRGPREREEMRKVLSELQGSWGETQIEATSAAFQLNLQNNQSNNSEALVKSITAWVAALLSLVDSRGILVRSPGCAIEDNRIVVAKDERGDTEAVGGIQVSIRFKDLLILMYLELYLDFLTEKNGGNEEAEFNSKDLMSRLLARIPQTSIHRNEVVGGMGHGIALFASRQEPEMLSGVSILDNRISGSAGAGICVTESAMIIELSIQRNSITNCGDSRGFSIQKGGINVNGSALLVCNDNKVTHCGWESNQSAYGIDLLGILGLVLSHNTVVANGGLRGSSADGGVRLRQIAGSVQVLGNFIENNRGMALLWQGAGNGKVLVNSVMELEVKKKQGLQFSAELPRAIMANNMINEGSAGLSPSTRIEDLESLSLSANSWRGTEMAFQCKTVRRLSAGLNQCDVNGKIAAIINTIEQGVVQGNVSTAPIDIQNSPTLIHVNNVPATI